MRRIEGKVALVTGGASGLGKAIAQRFVAEGAHVVITDLQTELACVTAAELGCSFLPQDVSDETRWTQIVDDLERHHGTIDILVNNAGVLGPMDVVNPENTALAEWRKIFAVNVEGVFLGCRAVIPAMRRSGRGGSIINMSSVAALLATPYATAYGASKAAVRHLTKSVAQYCAQEKLNVRCNSVHPGTIRTPLLDRGLQQQAEARGMSFDAVIEETRQRIPMGEFTQPEDVAAAVLFLSSEDARRITGEQLIVDAGTVHCDTYGRMGGGKRTAAATSTTGARDI